MIKVIATHKSPDLDAVTSVWLFQRFDAQRTLEAKLAFVNPGDTLTLQEAAQLDALPHEVINVDTGLGEFDHHQPERATQYLSASKIIYSYLCKQHPELQDDRALKDLVNHVTDIDQYAQVAWPESSTRRSRFTIDELISSLSSLPDFSDERVVQVGKMLLDSAYASLTKFIAARDEIEHSIRIEIDGGYCLGIETSNDFAIDVAQLQGAMLVVKKDPKQGNIRIKCRPDSPYTLAELRDAILRLDTTGFWYYHPGGKMLLNGSNKRPDQTPSPLTLQQVLNLVRKLYGK